MNIPIIDRLLKKKHSDITLDVLGTETRLLNGQTTIIASLHPYPSTTGLGVGAAKILIPVVIKGNFDTFRTEGAGVITLYIKTLS